MYLHTHAHMDARTHRRMLAHVCTQTWMHNHTHQHTKKQVCSTAQHSTAQPHPRPRPHPHPHPPVCDSCSAGRADDLWSWLYMCVELWCGRLPWRHRDTHAHAKESPPDKDAILDLKQRCQHDPAELMTSCVLPGESSCLLSLLVVLDGRWLSVSERVQLTSVSSYLLGLS